MKQSKKEFGDFQTPLEFTRGVCAKIAAEGFSPSAIIEPTCGAGTFLVAAHELFPHARVLWGLEINPESASKARAELASVNAHSAIIECGDFFTHNWETEIARLQDPLLIIGNPPWVTTSYLGAGAGLNQPPKANSEGMRGIEALTGAGGFDISEWMIQRAVNFMQGRHAVLAMLCKTAIARKVFHHIRKTGMPLACSMYGINAPEVFGADVDACLFVVSSEGNATDGCRVFRDLQSLAPDREIAVRDGKLIADLGAFTRTTAFSGGTHTWRSGIKHDCARVMEFKLKDGVWVNGLGEVADIEDTCLFPLMKSSDVARESDAPMRRAMLVTQRRMQDDPADLADLAPRTWAYLLAHADMLAARKSSVYTGRPRFAMFGIGPYTFTDWKVAVSGMYKRLKFKAVGPVDGKPSVFDDTCYFLPAADAAEARKFADALNSPAAGEFFSAYVFPDAKRPINAKILGRLNLRALLDK